MITTAYAQAAAAAPQQSFLASFTPLILVFLVFYFLILRPQKKKLEQEAEFLKNLTKGMEIYTKNGILGTIFGLTDKVATLDIGDGVKIKVLRSQIAGSQSTLFEVKGKAVATSSNNLSSKA